MIFSPISLKPNRRAPVNHPATAAFAELMENSIPQTTDLFNRMYKRPPPTTTSGPALKGSRTLMGQIKAQRQCCSHFMP